LLTVTHRSATGRRRGACRSGGQVQFESEQREGGAAAEDERAVLSGSRTEAGLLLVLRPNLLVTRIE